MVNHSTMGLDASRGIIGGREGALQDFLELSTISSAAFAAGLLEIILAF